MSCDAKIRPFPDDTELVCERPDSRHLVHDAVLRDYAYPGSLTVIDWFDDDRRCFHGDWPGICSTVPGCVLPDGHRGNHAP